MKAKENYQYKDIKKAQAKKHERIYKRVYFMLKNYCLFLTFTFNDETLKRTNQKTRLRYIKTFLNEQAKRYILNCDYGRLNDREHYHAIINPKCKGMIYFKPYKYGRINAIKINKLKRYKKNNKTLEEIATDLMNHTIKDTTKNTKVIYSRELKKNKRNPYKKQLKAQEEIIKLKRNEI